MIWKRCARVLDYFGYLDFIAERVTERGKWLADLRVDRPLLIGEALQRDLFASLDVKQTSALIAALLIGPSCFRDFSSPPYEGGVDGASPDGVVLSGMISLVRYFRLQPDSQWKNRRRRWYVCSPHRKMWE